MNLLLKILGMVCWVRGCRLASTHGIYCMGHKHLRYERTRR